MKHVLLHFKCKITYFHAKTFWQPHADLIAWFEMESVESDLKTKNEGDKSMASHWIIANDCTILQGPLSQFIECSSLYIYISRDMNA